MRSKPRSLPQSTIVLAHRTWHYTAVVPVAQAAAQQAGTQLPGRLPSVEQQPPAVPPPAEPATQKSPTSAAPATAVVQTRADTRDVPDDVHGLPNMGNTCAINAVTKAILLPTVERHSMATAAGSHRAAQCLDGSSNPRRPGPPTAGLHGSMRGGGQGLPRHPVPGQGGTSNRRPRTAPGSRGGPAQMPGDHARTDSGGPRTHQMGSEDTAPLRPTRSQLLVGRVSDRHVP